MFLLIAIHTFFTLLFPLLDFKSLKNIEPQQLVMKPYYFFMGVAVLILVIYGLDGIKIRTESTNLQKALNFIKFTILAPIESIFYTTVLYNQANEFHFKVLVAIGGILIFIIAIIGSNTFEKHGLKEVMFITVLVPIFYLSTTMILYSEIDFDGLIRFGPINFLCLATLLVYGAKKSILQQNQQVGLYSLSSLLGKQDSFRGLFLLISYCYLHGFIESVKTLNIK